MIKFPDFFRAAPGEPTGGDGKREKLEKKQSEEIRSSGAPSEVERITSRPLDAPQSQEEPRPRKKPTLPRLGGRRSMDERLAPPVKPGLSEAQRREHLSQGDEQKGAASMREAVFGSDKKMFPEGRISWPRDWERLGKRQPKGFANVDLSRRLERRTITRMLQSGGERAFEGTFDNYAPNITRDLEEVLPRLREITTALASTEKERKGTSLSGILPVANAVLGALEGVTESFKGQLGTIRGVLTDENETMPGKKVREKLPELFDAKTKRPSAEMRQMIEFWLWAKCNGIIPTYNDERRTSERIDYGDKSEDPEKLWMNAGRQFLYAIVDLTDWEHKRRAVHRRNEAARKEGEHVPNTPGVMRVQELDRVSKVSSEKIILVQEQTVPRSWLSDLMLEAPKSKSAIGYMGGPKVKLALEDALSLSIAPQESQKQRKRSLRNALGTASKVKQRQKRELERGAQRTPPQTPEPMQKTEVRESGERVLSRTEMVAELNDVYAQLKNIAAENEDNEAIGMLKQAYDTNIGMTDLNTLSDGAVKVIYDALFALQNRLEEE